MKIQQNIIIILFFTFYLFSCKNTPETRIPQQEDITPEITEKKNIINSAELFSAKRFSVVNNEKQLVLSVLDQENFIKSYSLAFIDNQLQVLDFFNYHQYEQNDEIIFLDSFIFQKKLYILHLEKYFNKTLISFKENTPDIKTFPICESIYPPQFYFWGNQLYLYYQEEEDNNLVVDIYNVKNLKKKTFLSNESISKFKISFSYATQYLYLNWINTFEKEKLYFSINNKKLWSEIPVHSFTFNQQIELPELFIKEEKMFMIMNIDYQYRYLEYYPLKINQDYEVEYKQINDLIENNEIDVNEYQIMATALHSKYYSLALKKEINNTQDQFILLLLADDLTNYSYIMFNDIITGKVSQVKMIDFQNYLIIFFIEEIADQKVLKYSILQLN
ncbi:MAG: hypothetical protein MJB14_08660 [Spirochaetes bacterium]|nr:hypothetical protein [Spirochaetota bacterium]